MKYLFYNAQESAYKNPVKRECRKLNEKLQEKNSMSHHRGKHVGVPDNFVTHQVSLAAVQIQMQTLRQAKQKANIYSHILILLIII